MLADWPALIKVGPSSVSSFASSSARPGAFERSDSSPPSQSASTDTPNPELRAMSSVARRKTARGRRRK